MAAKDAFRPWSEEDAELARQQGYNSGYVQARVDGMSREEIRARALECAVKYGADPQDWINFWDLVAKFEDYIRNGRDGT